ncbi:MAG TPA: hypothetical protein VMU53_14365 [Candidatus Sulfotelmatobacter sp.]|nr:hypothetical protein [Candidatus Sulfotelmatobacter sp.]
MAIGTIAAVLAGCSGTGSSGQSGGKGGGGSAVSLSLTPTSATVIVNNTEIFQATVTGSTNTAVTWEVNGVVNGNSTFGTISSAGIYTAPTSVPSPPTVNVIAIAQASTGANQSASVLIVASNPNQQAQSIPVKLGTSGGNANDSNTQGNQITCCGGTLGALVQRNGNFYILSANHVLARSDSANIGDPIIQPGLIDSDCSATGTTTVANLSQFANLQAAGTDVDAAIAQIVSGTVDTSGNILLLGSTATSGTPDPGPPHAGSGITATIGENVAKSGRTSGLTCSAVDAIEVQTSVSYQTGCSSGTTFNVTFTGQISVAGGSFSIQGDSGSLIVDQNTADPVGLLYGGSDTDTVANPVSSVLSALADSQGNRPTFVGSSATHNVIGCSLAANAAKTTQEQPPAAISAEQMALAQRARDLHAPELLANPYIQAIGVGASIDHPGSAAVILVVDPNQIPTAVPDELEGVPTRIVQNKAGAGMGPHGIFDANLAARIAPVVDTFAVNTLSKAELARARAVNAAHANTLMKQPGVQGVGITSSADAPGEAALMIFVIRGVPRNPLPTMIDGLRTRIRESSRFSAGDRVSQPGAGCRVPPVRPSAADFSE